MNVRLQRTIVIRTEFVLIVLEASDVVAVRAITAVATFVSKVSAVTTTVLKMKSVFLHQLSTVNARTGSLGMS